MDDLVRRADVEGARKRLLCRVTGQYVDERAAAVGNHNPVCLCNSCKTSRALRALPSATPSEEGWKKPGGIKLFEADIPPHKLMIFSAGKVYVFDTETGDMQEDSIANVYARAELVTKDTGSSARQAQRESWLRGEMALGLDGLQLCRSCRRHRATLSHKDTGDE